MRTSRTGTWTDRRRRPREWTVARPPRRRSRSRFTRSQRRWDRAAGRERRRRRRRDGRQMPRAVSAGPQRENQRRLSPRRAPRAAGCCQRRRRPPPARPYGQTRHRFPRTVSNSSSARPRRVCHSAMRSRCRTAFAPAVAQGATPRTRTTRRWMSRGDGLRRVSRSLLRSRHQLAVLALFALPFPSTAPVSSGDVRNHDHAVAAQPSQCISGLAGRCEACGGS